jgi:hypothetical protein
MHLFFSFFFWQANSIFAGSSEAFLADMRGDMPWSVVSQNQTNQTVHGHG